ncbi:hypothetical protein [Streptomyces sp. NPDC050759]|uniref:hypothetical protein n=1 Tax=Streptomyces sp. NPDC050759 TaxID=3365635 RepID=UPI0037A83BFB
MARSTTMMPLAPPKSVMKAMPSTPRPRSKRTSLGDDRLGDHGGVVAGLDRLRHQAGEDVPLIGVGLQGLVRLRAVGVDRVLV